MLSRPIEKIPRILIYKHPKPINVFGWSYRSNKPELYRMIDTKTGKYVGEMIGSPVVHDNIKTHKIFYPINKPYKSFYICYLESSERFSGYGKTFINFAKNISGQSGCNGRVHLIASRIYDRECPPHLFYKKCGFISNDKFMNSYLDSCVASKCSLELNFADNLNMYLPAGDKPEKISLKFGKFLNFLKRFI